MSGGSTLNLEFSFWKLPFLIVSAFKGVNFQKRLFTPPLGGILGPFTFIDEGDGLISERGSARMLPSLAAHVGGYRIMIDAHNTVECRRHMGGLFVFFGRGRRRHLLPC